MDKFTRKALLRTGLISLIASLLLFLLNILLILPVLEHNTKNVFLEEMIFWANSLSSQFIPAENHSCDQNAWAALDISTTISQNYKAEYFLPVCTADYGEENRASNLNVLKLPEFQKALNGQINAAFLPQDGGEISKAVILLPLQQGENVVGLLRITRSSEILANQLVRQKKIALLILLGFVFLLTAFILNINWRWVRPLLIISERLRNHDEESYNVPDFTSPEIRRFLQTIKQNIGENEFQINSRRVEENTFSAVLREMSDGILIVNQEGMVEFLNPSARELFDIPASFPYHQSLASTVRSYHVSDLFNACLQSGETHTIFIEIPGNKKYIQTIAKKTSDEIGGVVLFLFQDISRIHYLETIRRDFVSNVSHELRTPLASIKAVADTLQEGALNDPTVARKFLVSMQGEIDNLIQLVEELLELSRIESNQVPLVKQPVLPSQLIENAIERMHLQAERSGLKLINYKPDNLPKVYADTLRISQVLMNLIHNAIKYTPPGGEISISAATWEGMVKFYVKDNGCGIHPRDLNRIFERFYKTDRSRSAHGTGLGLSIARHIIELHGGKIWVESVLTQGSTFYFTLPIFKT